MNFKGASFWSKTPMVKILIPFIIGIVLQWNFQFHQLYLLILFGFFLLIYLFTHFKKFASFIKLKGSLIQLIFLCIGLLVFSFQDIKTNTQWVGNYYKDSAYSLVTIQEPLVEKTKSYKALATFDSIYIHKQWKKVTGKILLYFKKESLKPNLNYGTQILIHKNLMPIKNAGNPGGFNYEQYAAFQDIYHQVFLNKSDYIITNTIKENWFSKTLIISKNKLLNVLRQNIKNEKLVGVAEALLIGYRDDLDKNLVQAYSNTGVVHIIAISGLHLGMIYSLFIVLFSAFKSNKFIRWLKPLTILFVLWMFSFLAGAVPSIIRSAVMFSFILLADNLQRKTSIYNTLAASALVMLLVNPFFLWDVGFQLSYAAVISIVTFMKPISNWFYFENKIIRTVWQLNAVTLSAQILTLPIMLYHFHQFPNLFLLTNFVAVPLSGIILYLELILLLFAPFKAIAVWLGNIIAALIHFMNEYVERFNNLTISVADNIQINFLQVCFLTLFLLSISFYFFSKHKILLFSSLASLFILLLIRSIDVIQKNKQQKIIVYNVPQHKAIDVITGNQYSFIGDDVLLEDDFLQNFHLKPSRILNRIHLNQQLNSSSSCFNFNNKKIVILKNSILNLPINKIDADLIIIQDNPSLSFTQLNKVFNCNNYVADASNSLWKIKKWKKDCENLHLRLHSVQEQGAYIMEF